VDYHTDRRSVRLSFGIAEAALLDIAGGYRGEIRPDASSLERRVGRHSNLASPSVPARSLAHRVLLMRTKGASIRCF
jgi:hypothetical protein